MYRFLQKQKNQFWPYRVFLKKNVKAIFFLKIILGYYADFLSIFFLFCFLTKNSLKNMF